MNTKNSIIILLHFVLIFFIMQQSAAFSLSDTGRLIIPSSDLYKNSWGGEYTRIKTDLLDKNRNYALALQVEGDSAFVFPTANRMHVCSHYGIRSGRMHTGMDIKQRLGDSIVAAWSGVVRMAKSTYYGYGGTVLIRHNNGLETLYAHLSSINVEENQQVNAGELIGLAGRTGRATTEHLHFETRFLYEYFDPRIIIDFNNFSLAADTLYVIKGNFSKENKHIQEIATNTVNATANTTENTTANTVSNNNTASGGIYTVKKGDTLYAIAKRHNISVELLCKINNITQESTLQIGQKLKVEK